jgi:hypothetical protein
MLGVDPKMIVPSENVALIRQQRAEQQAQAQQAAVAESQSKTVSNLANADMSQDNALTNIMDQFTGYNTPGVLK